VNRCGIYNTTLCGGGVTDNDLLLLALVHVAIRAWVEILESRALGLETGSSPEVTFDIDKVAFSMADIGAADNTKLNTALVGVLKAVRV
jgi:hypothetical protein